MFRRIELIGQLSERELHNLILSAQRHAGADEWNQRFWKSGIMGSSTAAVSDAWDDINTPRRAIYKNCRFFFTEEGWRRYGRPTIKACQRSGQMYRIIKIKEKSVDVLYRDDFQVAVRPRKGRKAGSREPD